MAEDEREDRKSEPNDEKHKKTRASSPSENQKLLCDLLARLEMRKVHSLITKWPCNGMWKPDIRLPNYNFSIGRLTRRTELQTKEPLTEVLKLKNLPKCFQEPCGFDEKISSQNMRSKELLQFQWYCSSSIIVPWKSLRADYSREGLQRKELTQVFFLWANEG